MSNLQEPIIVQFEVTNPTVKQKIYRMYQSHIPIKELFEQSINQADLEYYQSQLVNDFPV